jgi:hypothetical protein
MSRLYVERSCQHSTLSIQHSVISFQRFAFDSMVQEMNRTVIRGTERMLSSRSILCGAGMHLVAAISTDHGCLNAKCSLTLPNTHHPPETPHL